MDALVNTITIEMLSNMSIEDVEYFCKVWRMSLVIEDGKITEITNE